MRSVFYRFGSWLLNIDDVEAVMYDDPFKLRVRMKTGREYTLTCQSAADRDREKEAMVRTMGFRHPEPISRYELEAVVQREVAKVRRDIRSLKTAVIDRLEGLRRE